MSLFMDILKEHHLSEFYLSLPVDHKETWKHYFPRACGCAECESGSAKKFPIKSKARLLWVTAANCIPHEKYEFAELLLNRALDYTENNDDKLWIHSNLAQLYYDQIDIKPEAVECCRHHCEELSKMGYLNRWVENIMWEIGEK